MVKTFDICICLTAKGVAKTVAAIAFVARWPQTLLFFVSAHPRTLITQIGFTCPFLCNMIFKPRSKVKGVIEMKKVFTPTNEN